MKLYLHIGIEKTGSSYLQSVLAVNRPFLLEQGFFFPKAGKREQDMLAGRISPGNAFPLTEALIKKNKVQILEFLKLNFQKARKNNSNTILLSNENLVRGLAREDQMDLFLSCCNESQIVVQNSLLTLRDPAEHALSLYKHRARKGKASSFENWLQDSYRTPRVLDGFFKNMKKFSFPCMVRKYVKSSEKLRRDFFEEWLQIPQPVEEGKTSVNPSLTLSELWLMRKIRAIDEDLVHDLHHRFIQIPHEDRVSNPEVISYYLDLANKYLSKYSSTFNMCNQWLPTEEHLVLNEYSELKEDRVLFNLELSEQQADQWILYFEESRKPSFYLRIQIRKLKRMLSYIRDKITFQRNN